MLAAGTTAQASFSTVTFAIAVLAPALREEYDLSLTQVGVVLTAEWIGLTLSLLPWGFAADRFGERWTLAVGLVGCGVCLVGCGVRARLRLARRSAPARAARSAAACSPAAAAR